VNIAQLESRNENLEKQDEDIRGNKKRKERDVITHLFTLSLYLTFVKKVPINCWIRDIILENRWNRMIKQERA